MRTTALAFAFLTRLPVPAVVPRDGDLTRASALFPLVGLVVAALGVAGRALVEPLLGPAAGTVAGVLVAVAVTGAFHEDGLADTADAFAAGGDLERRLRVMDDPRIGAVGAVVLVLALLGRVAALALLPLATAAMVLVAAHTLARWSVPALLWRLPYVRGEAGIAARLKSGATGARLAAATAVALAVVVAVVGSLVLVAALAAPLLPAGLSGPPASAAASAAAPPLPAGLSAPPISAAAAAAATDDAAATSGARAAATAAAATGAASNARAAAVTASAAVAAALLVTLAAGALFRRRFGGVTGDLLGAACQAVELAVYLAVLAVVHRGG